MGQEEEGKAERVEVSIQYKKLRRLRGAAKGGAEGTEERRFLVSVNNIHVC